jgi:hypothetical protein
MTVDVMANEGPIDNAQNELQVLCGRRSLPTPCSVEPGSMAIDAKEVLKRFASIGANGAIASRTGPERRSTILILTELMHFGLSPVVSMKSAAAKAR